MSQEIEDILTEDEIKEMLEKNNWKVICILLTSLRF